MACERVNAAMMFLRTQTCGNTTFTVGLRKPTECSYGPFSRSQTSHLFQFKRENHCCSSRTSRELLVVNSVVRPVLPGSSQLVLVTSAMCGCVCSQWLVLAFSLHTFLQFDSYSSHGPYCAARTHGLYALPKRMSVLLIFGQG